METENKYFYLISSVYSPIKVAWFIGKQLQVVLYQRNNTNDADVLSVFEYLDETDARISLYRIKELNLKKIDKFDYLLVLENYSKIEPQKLRDSKFINYITELPIEDLPKAVKKNLKYL